MSRGSYRDSFGDHREGDNFYVYIAGPMRGYPAYNFPAFFQAEHTLYEIDVAPADQQILVFNPARNDVVTYGLDHLTPEAAGAWLLAEQAAFSIRDALGDDTAWISKFADAVMVLPGWENSKGAQAEVALAYALGIEVWTFDPETGDTDSLEVEEVEAQGFETIRLTPREAAQIDAANGGEVRTKSSTGGEKGTKLARYDLIPVEPLRLLAEHYGRGANKYADNQWRQGYEFSKSIAAKQRHFEAWRGGEDFDVCPQDRYGCRDTDMDGNPYAGVPSENGPTCFNHTGSHHLAADLWHSMFLLEGTKHWPEHDDRFTYPEKDIK